MPAVRMAAISVQYQNGQIRLAAIMEGLRGRSEGDRQRRQERAQAMLDTGEWFSFEAIDQVLGVRAKPQPNPSSWLRYDPNFVYRYRSSPAVTANELITIMVSCAERLLASQSAAAAFEDA
jgi:hypothetical protein